jgi:translocation and assembly module TamA
LPPLPDLTEMKRTIRLCLALLLLGSCWVNASTLTFSVSGLQGEAEKTVLVWLGPEPESAQDRRSFVVSVRDRVERSLQALGYYRPAIDIDIIRTEPTWRVDIAVEPGEPVRIRTIDLQILGAAASDDAFTQLLANTGLSQGDVLHHGRFERFRDSLLSLGQQRGYFDARIARSRVEVDASAGTADIFIHFDSGRRYRFGDMIYDHQLADSDLLDALATFSPGDYFEQSRLQELQAQLQRTGYFSSILMQPLREQVEDDLVPIAITLQAAKRHRFQAGIGYSTDTEERLSLTWRTPRINRYGHSQINCLEYSRVNPSGRFTYNIPLGNPLNDVLQLWARIEENEFGDLDSRQKELGTRREIRNGKWIYGYSLRGLNESWDVLQESATNDYLLAGISLSSRSHHGSLVDPASGFNQLYTLEAGNQEFAPTWIFSASPPISGT